MEDIFEELAPVLSDEEGRVDERAQPAGDDEAQEVDENKRVVKPKRTVSRPRPKLDPARLLGPRGIFVVTSTFDGVKLKGKGHELDDLNNVLSRLQHWAHRLFPKMTFEDCIDRIEELGNKREIQTNMHKIRMGMIDLDGQTNQADNEVGDDPAPVSPPPADNPFDQLLASAAQPSTLTDEQRARMMRNRLLAEERRMARRLAREKELEEQRMNSTQNTTSMNNDDFPTSSVPEEQQRETTDDTLDSVASVSSSTPNNSSSAQMQPTTASTAHGELSPSRGNSSPTTLEKCRLPDACERSSTSSQIHSSSELSQKMGKLSTPTKYNSQAAGDEEEGNVTDQMEPSPPAMETDD